MSIESWRQEFYPIEAKNVGGSDIELIEHSILKWTGLLEENLAKHDLRKHRPHDRVLRDSESTFLFNADTCALCVKYLEYGSEYCCHCPLRQYLGRSCNDFEFSLYDDALQNPRLMIDALEKAKAFTDTEGTRVVEVPK